MGKFLQIELSINPLFMTKGIHKPTLRLVSAHGDLDRREKLPFIG